MHLHGAGEAAVSEGNLQRTMGEQKSPKPGPTPPSHSLVACRN